MDLQDYLSLTLGKRFDLRDNGATAAMLISTIRNKDIFLRLEHCALLENFENMSNGDIHALVSRSLSVFDILQHVQEARTNQGVYEALINAVSWPNEDVSKSCLALVSDWVFPELVQVTANGPNPLYVPDEETPAKNTPLHAGWLATGTYPVVREVNGQHTTTPVALNNDLAGDQDLPVEVHMARILHATWDAEKGCVDPVKLEAMAPLLAGLMEQEREHAKAMVAQAQKTAKEVPSLWPADPSHWIFQLGAGQMIPPLAMTADNPKRAALETMVAQAAKFAVARASGHGSSRIFNIEGFVNNVVIGLLGDRNDPTLKDFDVAAVFETKPVAKTRAPRKTAAVKPVKSTK